VKIPEQEVMATTKWNGISNVVLDLILLDRQKLARGDEESRRWKKGGGGSGRGKSVWFRAFGGRCLGKKATWEKTKSSLELRGQEQCTRTRV